MFEPYIIPLIDRKFRVETQEGEDWYNPIKWYTMLEYEWVRENIPLDDQKIIDCGGHHGHYSLVLGGDNELVIVEPHPGNVSIIFKNLNENIGAIKNARVVEGAVYSRQCRLPFTGASNGHLSSSGAFEVNCYTLKELMPDANIIKLDIEGGEYAILPEAIDEMVNAHTWIIELHPQFGNPNPIISAFLKRGYTADKVCRKHHEVEPYDPCEYWDIHSTVIFRRAL